MTTATSPATTHLAQLLIHAASQPPGTVPELAPDPDDILALDADLTALMARAREIWWERLTPAQQLAVYVDRLCRSPHATAINDLVVASRLATAAGYPPVTLPEYTTLTQALIQPAGLGTWSAIVGTAPRGGAAGELVGDYGSIRAARAAAWDAVAARQEQVRIVFRTSGSPLARLADRGWQDPTVTVWANRHQHAEDDATLVTVHQIAHRAQVDTGAVRSWIQQSDFPTADDSRHPDAAVIWAWPPVEQWLRQHGHVPDTGFADERREIPSDLRF